MNGDFDSFRSENIERDSGIVEVNQSNKQMFQNNMGGKQLMCLKFMHFGVPRHSWKLPCEDFHHSGAITLDKPHQLNKQVQ